MKRLGVFIALVFLLASSQGVDAAFVTVSPDGSTWWNVLASEDSLTPEIPKSSSLEVKNADNGKLTGDVKISLGSTQEGMSLIVSGDGEERTAVLAGTVTDVIEIEERPESQKLAIGVRDGKFLLTQRGVVAVSEYPIKVDAKKAEILLDTQTGERFLAIFPRQALDAALRARILNNLGEDLQIAEEEGELFYKVNGTKDLNLFNVYTLSMPVSAKISAVNGKMLAMEAPLWFRVLDFLLSEEVT